MVQKWKYREHKGRQGKFRVGDLVQVSSYALTTEQNEHLLLCNHKDMVGLIVNIGDNNYDKYPIKVDWISDKKKSLPRNFFFRELKRKRT